MKTLSTEVTEGKPVVDPMRSLIENLSKGERQARETLSGMSQRPWEQLPSRLKSAARDDVSAALQSGRTRADLLADGYKVHTLTHILRDLGLGG
ncbi:hypothetical protein P6U16_08400 [Rhizobium sp. 32-5/1]|uniref:hypothetical protein n=1 Tax=Rhizobium sp. 32-5/1 TaxID=3019602 RepID=UPI00240DB1B2|nr:hypothetical protein [Rhizobium sp. 32-5/1]WEZ84580.1 hypothetical protein P6U16_08400 [Rhizobium sp. 32-5/1]